MSLETRISVPQQSIETSSDRASSVSLSRTSRFKKTVVAAAASASLLFSGAQEVSAAPGHSDTATKEQGPKCWEVFGTTADSDSFYAQLMSQPNHSSILELQKNSTNGSMDGLVGVSDVIFLDCNIVPAGNSETSAEAIVS